MSARRITLLFALLCCLHASAASAAERYALVVTGAAGGEVYAERYDAWRRAFVDVLRGKFEYPPDNVIELGESEAAGVLKATRENVRSALAALQARTTAADTVLILLMGHGASADGDTAKFNLVGPDLSADEWGALVQPLRARVVFIDAASGSFPYLAALTGPNRVVVSANDSPAQQFETMLPEFLVKAFDAPQADTDKNGRVSIWEAFVYASDGVRRWYEERGQLATERPLLEDNGDGTGREAAIEGDDGPLAKVTYLQPEPSPAETGDAARVALVRRRNELALALEELRARKSTLPDDQYESALERLLLEIAQIDRRLRSPS